MTAGLDPSGGAGVWVVLGIVLAAVVVAVRRTRTERPPRRPRRRAVLVVAALAVGTILVGTPAMAQALDCKTPPEPDRPGTGLVGSLDRPSALHGELGSVYEEVGYAGLVWHNYDLGCAASGVLNPSVTTDTWLGNQVFNLAKLSVGGVNWAHYLIADGGALFEPLDTVISTATRAMYETVFTTWVGLALLGFAIIVLLLAMRGDLARQAQRTAIAVLALMIGSAAYLAPVNWSRAADDLLLDGVTQMQEGFLGQIGLGTRDTLPTILVDQVAYQNWLRGTFGAPDVPQAQELGRDLLRAQAFTIDAIDQGQDTSETAERKKADYSAIADRMGDRYAYFTGATGSRIGAGTLALVQAACIALFQLLAKVLVLVALLIIRLLVVCAPAVAVVALLKPDVIPAILRIAGAAVVNTLVVGALAGLHALLVVSLFAPGSGIDLWLALLVTGVVTLVMWAVARPFRRLVSMVSLTREQFGGIVPGVGDGPMSKVWNRMRGPLPGDERQSRWWSERGTGPGAGDPDAARPEAETVAGPGARSWRRRPQPEVPGRQESNRIAEPRRGQLPVGASGRPGTGPAVPGRTDPGEIDDRSIYRRDEASARRPGDPSPVTPELVDGVSVYKIYRPRAARTADGRDGGRAD
ncbi:hypothetical protein Ae168Ps1_3294c [Pseudonocardia sp. Ae168_Ps1]|uniref:hypothetical protein n=1 Tax=unclassified Pseudonocardia TaxID=2619320 RepID=UPI00094B696C|nr:MULTISPECIES: hypothetical protein [unclassified Pseudonocardia]OLL74896.1 hypothetical protein Ae150APs1_3274c [Pseudonocardia sp. Ae150A_Ps1]OLL80888.1 hypothetical protein Ae168Ps1_3294c [Pseudonocardia sp. Ae168_Ps1]OLL84994.1 hypothetical protein Ae263Ps1_2049 [Pseudonocardia sp. Ae263_Ps1]OLL94989.1 hypothetical protein Ae356Ps1_4886c [Pseudonocardia sp. Ae356_Ps1]